jgi:putative adhesin
MDNEVGRLKDMITALLTSLMMLACGMPQPASSSITPQRDFKERDEINQTFQLAPGARIEVSSIRGPVEITTGDGATAEVHIVRTARSRADLEYHKIEVRQTSNSLVVRGVQEREDRQRENVQVNHHVMLKLPRSIDVTVNSVSGSIKVGDVDGPANVSSISGAAEIGNVGGKLEVSSISGSLNVGNVGAEARVSSISGRLNIGNVGADARVNSISGDVGLDQVNGSLEAQNVSGGVKVTLLSLSSQGIQIRNVSGSVEIGFKSDVNADFNAQHVTGQVYLNIPNVIQDLESKSSNVRARIGGGGTPITITNVSGNIRLTRS